MNHNTPRGSLAANEHATREEQLEVGRRMIEAESEHEARPRSTLSLPSGLRRPSTPQARSEPVRHSGVPRAVARAGGQVRTMNGHEAFLKALIISNADIYVEKCDGKKYTGRIKHADKFTITMNVEGSDRVIFKHDISEFSAVTPRQAEGQANV